jgi:hypothetical protein
MEDFVKQENRIKDENPNSSGGVDYILENGSWLGDSFNYLPPGIIDKRETGIGATTLEIKSKRHSIIIEPLKSTVSLKAENNDNLFAYLVENNKLARDLRDYLNDEQIVYKKIILVIDNLKRLINDIGEDIFNYFLLFDEIDYMQGSSSYRKEMELGLDIGKIQGNYALVSATLIDFSDPELKSVPITSFKYEKLETVNVQTKYITNTKLKDNLKHVSGLNWLCSYIVHKLRNSNEKIFVAVNSVKIIDDLATFLIKQNLITNQEITLLISESNYKNQIIINKYSGLKITKNQLPTRLNFATSAYFNGFDLEDNYSLAIFSSPLTSTMLLTVNEVKQIYGRCRNSGINDFVLISFDMLPDKVKYNNYLSYSFQNWMHLAETHVDIADCIDKHFKKSLKDIASMDETTYFFYNQFKEQVEGNEYNLSRTKLDLTKENLVELVLNTKRENFKNIPAYLQIDYLMHYYNTLNEMYLMDEFTSHVELFSTPKYVSNIINFERKLSEVGYLAIESVEKWEYVKFKAESKTHKEEILETLEEVLEYRKENLNITLSPFQKKMNSILERGFNLYTEKSVIKSIYEINTKQELNVFRQYISMKNPNKHQLVVLLKNLLNTKKIYTSSELVSVVKTVFSQMNLTLDKKLTYTKATVFIKLIYNIGDVPVRVSAKVVENHYKLVKHNPFPELKKRKKQSTKISVRNLSLGKPSDDFEDKLYI